MDKKFKIGDIVIANAQATDEYFITKAGWIGEVVGFCGTRMYVQTKRQDTRVFLVKPKYFDLYKDTSKKKQPVNTIDGRTPGIKKVIFNNPATVVIWDDDTKTVVKCQPGKNGKLEKYDKEKGLALCIAKKVLGNKSNFNNTFKKWTNQ